MVEFLHGPKSIREKAFKNQTIIHGFRDIGIVPYNLLIVLEAFDDYRPPTTPIPDSPQSPTWSWGSTPKTVKRFETMDWNLRHLERSKSDFSDNLKKFGEG